MVEFGKAIGPWKTRVITVDGVVWGKMRKVTGAFEGYIVICDCFIYSSGMFRGATTNTQVCKSYADAKWIVRKSVLGIYPLLSENDDARKLERSIKRERSIGMLLATKLEKAEESNAQFLMGTVNLCNVAKSILIDIESMEEEGADDAFYGPFGCFVSSTTQTREIPNAISVEWPNLAISALKLSNALKQFGVRI